MTEPVGTSAYSEHLAALLPRGRAWTRAANSTLLALLRTFAAGMAALDLKALQTRIEILPSHTTDLIVEWERAVGLPDECSSVAADLPTRRAAVIERLVARPNLSRQTFIDLARSFGLTIRVEEFDQARAQAIPGIDTSGGRHRFVWWITITADDSAYFSTLSDVSQPLLEFTVDNEFICRLRRLNPAHTHLEIAVSLT